MQLNDVILYKCKKVWRTSDVKFELDPKTNILLSDNVYLDFYAGFANIVDEIEQYRENSRKVKTDLYEDNIRIALLSSGPHIDQEVIDKLNRSYQGEQIHMIKQSGSFHIGEYFRKVNGVVIIENCDEKLYTARNIITLKQ